MIDFKKRMQPIDFHFDFETRSRANLKKEGAVKYARDPSTEITLLTYCFGRTGMPFAWRQGQPLPSNLVDVIHNPEKYRMIAFHMEFDYLIWTHQLRKIVPTMAIPPLANLACAQAHALQFRTGDSLEFTAATLEIEHRKDKKGHAIMLKQCKPGRNGKFPVLTDEEWEHFIRYGVQDTLLLRKVFYKLPPLSPEEQYLWAWTFVRNIKGLDVDWDLVDAMREGIEEVGSQLAAEFAFIVQGAFTMNSTVKFRDWLNEGLRGIYQFLNVQSATLEDAYEGLSRMPGVPFDILRAIKIRLLAGSASLRKIARAYEMRSEGRIHGTLRYHGTQSKRWSGQGIQIQNFPRPTERYDTLSENSIELADDVYNFRKDLAKPEDFLEVTKNLLRRIWVSPDERAFYCGDYSKIEPVTTFWLLDMGEIPDMWYEKMAAKIFNMPVTDVKKESMERDVGKATALGCTYGLGPHGFQAQLFTNAGLKIPFDICEKAIFAYEQSNPRVVQFWDELKMAFQFALEGKDTELCNGRVIIGPMKHNYGGQRRNNIQMRLPSGDLLYYHDVRCRDGNLDFYNGKYEQGHRGRKDRTKLHGGGLCAHVISSTARGIMAPAFKRLQEAQFEVLNTVHDELWALSKRGREEAFRKAMEVVPGWAGGIDLKVDVMHGVRYLK